MMDPWPSASVARRPTIPIRARSTPLWHLPALQGGRRAAFPGSGRDCYDNALCENFFATSLCELLDLQKFPCKAETRMAGFQFIEGWYNLGRRRAALGYLSPVNFESRARDQPKIG